jgi:DNA-binding transcriptional MerR regulator
MEYTRHINSATRFDFGRTVVLHVRQGKYYLIHEVSELSGLSLSQLRYYERIGLVVPERDEKNKYRKYSPEDIYILASLRNLLRTRLPPRLIKQIAELGISAQAIERVNTAILSLNEQISAASGPQWTDRAAGGDQRHFSGCGGADADAHHLSGTLVPAGQRRGSSL